MATVSKTRDTVELLERWLIGGRARWVADLREFFRGFRIRETTFDLYVRGGTRNRGFLMSRFFAWSALPDYHVALLCISSESVRSRMTSEKLRKAIDDALYHVGQEELKWAWLIAFLDSEVPAWGVSLVSRYDRQELGLSLASTATGQVVVSANQIGRSIRKQLGLNKLMERIVHDKAN
ncbi:MAG: hypothetical protein AUI50_05205 [Crenarchaeota archaeon 13_1_40CM_2_52_14]|nr:MAG: hypothetical protein AUI97_00890 [Crenarchaeota archaeon 13_1_40CM_3_52_17]OLD34786.1 MAG: hypothetical protein AUI50_05205 [Crenarchaeota archaeon 13_1_40CM_2_52_14]